MVRRLWKFLGNSRPQVHDAFLSESWNEFPRLGIDGDQTPVARSRQYLGRGLLVSLPVSDTAQWGGDAAQIIFPDFFACLRIEGHNTVMDRGCVEDAAGHNRDGFGRRQYARRRIQADGTRIDAVLPDQLEFRNISGIDLCQRRIALASLIMAVRGPIGLSKKSHHGKAGRKDACQDPALYSSSHVG